MNCPYCKREMKAGVVKFDHYDGGVGLKFIPHDVERISWWKGWFCKQPGSVYRVLSNGWGPTPEHDGHICECGATVFKS